MSDTKLDPASLTSEERAIVDHEASRFHRDWAASARYQAAMNLCEPIILARRALFAPTKEEKFLQCGCVRCTCEDEIQCQGCGAKLCETHRKTMLAEPTPPSEMPVSETVTVGAWQLEDLLKYADYAEVALRTGFHPPDFIFATGDRSLRQAIDVIKKQRDEWRSQPARGDGGWMECPNCEVSLALIDGVLISSGPVQPAPAVRMTPELERVLAEAETWAAYHTAFSGAFPALRCKEIREAIAAVRAQASQPQSGR